MGRQTLQETGLFLNDCIWSLKVKAGQRISFTVFSFLYGQTRGTRNNKQVATGENKETTTKNNNALTECMLLGIVSQFHCFRKIRWQLDVETSSSGAHWQQ